jgi:NAD(P)-dependent dehydrogenase (short-subunit alcohol dehydrogenase family)
VVVIGSTTGKRPLYGRTPYAASKTALIGLVRTLAVELGPAGVRVNLISPGVVDGPRIDTVIREQARAAGTSYEAVYEEATKATPLRRLVPPDDVADATVFLASDASASITGEDLNVSGGLAMY